MGDSNTVQTTQAVAAIANSKAAQKLSGAIGGLVDLGHKTVDYIAGPKRIAAVSEARAQGAVQIAKAEAEIEMLRAETADYVLDREMRKTVNRRSIVSEAYKALPPPNVSVSDEPPARDFVPGVLDEFDGISDPEIHKIVGRLIAGEVVRPGSFSRRTIRILRDLDSRDFARFRSLCRFAWHIGNPTLLVFDSHDSIYKSAGVTFGKLKELTSLGLVSFEQLRGFAQGNLPTHFKVHYGDTVVRVILKEGANKLFLGQVAFTDAGRCLAELAQAQPVPEAVEYTLRKWRDDGHQAHIVSSGAAAAPESGVA